MKSLLLALVAVAAVAAAASPAMAQYPPPDGACEIHLSATIAKVGDRITVKVKVVDNSGDPVAGEKVTFIAEGHVIDTKTTDDDGKASTTFTAGAAGTISLVAQTSDLECRAQVRVGDVKGPDSPDIATGNTGSGGDSGWETWGLLGGAGLLIVGGVGVLGLTRRTR